MFITIVDINGKQKSIRKSLILVVTEYAETSISERSKAYFKDVKSSITLDISSISTPYNSDGPMTNSTTTIYSQSTHDNIMNQLNKVSKL